MSHILKNATDYQNKKNYDDAINLCKSFLEKTKDTDVNLYINTLQELGNLYEIVNKNMEAITECYIKIIKIQPFNGVILNQIGVCYFKMNQFKLAIHYFEKILKIKQLEDVYCNIGNCYVSLKQYDLAKDAFISAYKLNKTHNLTNSSLGSLYYYIKDYKKSIEHYEKLKNLDATDLYNLSFPYLGLKKFEKGFELYENRLKIKSTTNPQNMGDRVELPFLPEWDGNESCDSLLVIAEQGLGDMIQFYRFILDLVQKKPSIKITFFCKIELAHLFETYNKFDIITEMTFLTAAKYQRKAYLMSLPSLLKVTDIQANSISYIKTDENVLLYWKNKMSSLKKFKVGFVYNGLLSSFIEKYIPLNEFKELCNLDIDLICLHRKKDIEHDVKDMNLSSIENLHFFDIDADVPFQDTIHILKNIDLLITIDTFIVHLAGIMNVKTWLLLGYSEWRWGNDENTYWYNSVELIRSNGGEFKNTIKTAKQMLKKLI
jgi:tetratricopeptide (TPR) repeat protein